MITFPGPFETHLQGDVTTIARCWAITKSTGDVIRSTEHDRDLVITTGPYAGTYRAAAAISASDLRVTTDGAVQNLEVEGAFQYDVAIPDLTVAEIEGGAYDQATAVLFEINWAAPDQGYKELCAGTLGDFQRDSNGQWRSEVRGLTQALQQQVVQTYSERCNVRLFGDDRCKFDVDSVTRTGTVATVTDRKHFTVTLAAGPAPVNATYYNGGRLLFVDGDNATFVREIKSATLVSLTLTVVLHDEAPADITIGDAVEVPPGCDRRFSTCRDVHANQENFRGYGLFAVGRDRLIKGVNT